MPPTMQKKEYCAMNEMVKKMKKLYTISCDAPIKLKGLIILNLVFISGIIMKINIRRIPSETLIV
jgi:hypothetical protein